jgi:hypothetical protein
MFGLALHVLDGSADVKVRKNLFNVVSVDKGVALYDDVQLTATDGAEEILRDGGRENAFPTPLGGKCQDAEACSNISG